MFLKSFNRGVRANADSLVLVEKPCGKWPSSVQRVVIIFDTFGVAPASRN